MKPTRTGIVIADRSRAHILLNEGLVKGFDRVQRGLPILGSSAGYIVVASAIIYWSGQTPPTSL